MPMDSVRTSLLTLTYGLLVLALTLSLSLT
jgi:hypothetical protein